jgi:hypothetical protein
LLIRLFRGQSPDKLPWALKGGYAMELRIQSARATKDIHLTARLAGPADAANDTLLQKLQESAVVKDSLVAKRTLSPLCSHLHLATGNDRLQLLPGNAACKSTWKRHFYP